VTDHYDERPSGGLLAWFSVVTVAGLMVWLVIVAAVMAVVG